MTESEVSWELRSGPELVMVLETEEPNCVSVEGGKGV